MNVYDLKRMLTPWTLVTSYGVKELVNVMHLIPHFFKSKFIMDNDNVIMTSKRRLDVVMTL